MGRHRYLPNYCIIYKIHVSGFPTFPPKNKVKTNVFNKSLLSYYILFTSNTFSLVTTFSGGAAAAVPPPYPPLEPCTHSEVEQYLLETSTTVEQKLDKQFTAYYPMFTNVLSTEYQQE